MTKFPKDPAMLLSYVNTQLRDFYPSMEELCKAMDAKGQEMGLSIRVQREDIFEAMHRI